MYQVLVTAGVLYKTSPVQLLSGLFVPASGRRYQEVYRQQCLWRGEERKPADHRAHARPVRCSRV